MTFCQNIDCCALTTKFSESVGPVAQDFTLKKFTDNGNNAEMRNTLRNTESELFLHYFNLLFLLGKFSNYKYKISNVS